MVKLFRRFTADTSGATAIEYVLIAVGLSTAALVTIDAAGIKLGVIFANVSASILGH